MGFVRKHTGIDLTGGGARRAAEQAAREQASGIKAGEKALRADLAPFRQFGVDALERLGGIEFTPRSAEDILNDPFFRAMAEEQDRNLLSQRAALGLAGSGGTQDALTRNMLLLGDQFRRQDLADQFSKFNSLFNLATLGANAAARTGTASLQAAQDIGGLRGVPHLARAQQQQGLTQMAGQLGGAIMGGPAGSFIGGNLFGGGSPVAPPVFSGGAGMGMFGTGSIGF